MGAAVELHGIKKSFGSVNVIDGVDLAVEQGEFVVFVGPSGSGKSTLLRVIAGLESTTSGDIIIDDHNVTYAEPSDRGIAMVFQSYALYPHMNVFENIAFNLRLAKTPKSEVDRLVLDAARILKLEALLDRSPAQLSGGQRQRVAIGRAIVRQPKVFLFDEPLSNLDAGMRVEMRLEIERLHRELGAAMVYVTHDQVEAMTLADRIVALDDGHIQQIGSPLELYKNPSNLFVAGFIGSPKMNLVTGKVGQVASENSVELDGKAQVKISASVSGQASGDVVTVGIRPEAVKIVQAGQADAIQAEIEAIERLGNVTYVYADAGMSQLVTIQVDAEFSHNIGDKLAIAFAPEQLHLFDKDGQVITP
ncbi:ABC transporter ATP-binding protein [Cognatishimia sp.]|uniref:ABC transporter ATP-binding protein n=1 Tax=Cognatishimia sp. TaxID=2211648 RepID=UPI0035125A6C|nr:sn-glycerol-3-phosphate ABC transporter ATP-binding protein UgpC [Cognatishimia sp.]